VAANRNNAVYVILNMKKLILFALLAGAVFLFSTQNGTAQAKRKLSKPASEWKKVLTPNQYEIMVESGTEIPYKKRLLE